MTDNRLVRSTFARHTPPAMFAKHLPPSAGLPRVLALDAEAARELPPEIELTQGGSYFGSEYDAIVGHASPDNLTALLQLLRPGGRLILAYPANPQSLLTSLTEAGFIHCLVEPHANAILYRGERPPEGASVERVQTLAAQSPILQSPFLFLLITQTPNKPAWRLSPGETLEWQAVTVLDPVTGQPTLLAFSSLVKAVAFMQSAILNSWIKGVNKVGKFRAEVAQTWAWPFMLNPAFESTHSLVTGPSYQVDSQTAIAGEE